MRWVEAGMHGAMGYLARPDRLERRKDLLLRRVNLQRKSPALVIDEFRQAFEIGFIEFRADRSLP